MKIRLAILPLALLGLTGCGTINQLNCLLNESTMAIDSNREAVEYNTQAICQNVAVVRASTITVTENRKQLESIKE